MVTLKMAAVSAASRAKALKGVEAIFERSVVCFSCGLSYAFCLSSWCLVLGVLQV